MARNYYEVLGVSRDATGEEIKKAFRRIARATHPDSNGGDPESAAAFREAAEAYEVLSDPERRRRYDRGDSIDLSDLFGGMGGLDDLLRSVFGDGSPFGGGPRSTRPSRGRDILVRVEVDLAGAAFGTESAVEFRSRTTCVTCAGTGSESDEGHSTCPECGGTGSVRATRRSLFGTMMTVGTCPTCEGEGTLVTEPCSVCRGLGSVEGDTSVTVEIPPGVTTGTRLRLSGRGESGGRSGPSGDLYVEILVAPDARFERREDDLVHHRPIGIAEATLGTKVSVPLIEGGESEVLIPPGTQPGSVFTLPGLGMTRLGRRTRGDLHLVVSVEVPQSLTAEEEEILRQWAGLRGEKIERPTPTS